MRRFFRLKRADFSCLLALERLERRLGFERMDRGDGGGCSARRLPLRECAMGAAVLLL
jgi:hypothetical protein